MLRFLSSLPLKILEWGSLLMRPTLELVECGYLDSLLPAPSGARPPNCEETRAWSLPPPGSTRPFHSPGLLTFMRGHTERVRGPPNSASYYFFPNSSSASLNQTETSVNRKKSEFSSPPLCRHLRTPPFSRSS